MPAWLAPGPPLQLHAPHPAYAGLLERQQDLLERQDLPAYPQHAMEGRPPLLLSDDDDLLLALLGSEALPGEARLEAGPGAAGAQPGFQQLGGPARPSPQPAPAPGAALPGQWRGSSLPCHVSAGQASGSAGQPADAAAAAAAFMARPGSAPPALQQQAWMMAGTDRFGSLAGAGVSCQPAVAIGAQSLGEGQRWAATGQRGLDALLQDEHEMDQLWAMHQHAAAGQLEALAAPRGAAVRSIQQSREAAARDVQWLQQQQWQQQWLLGQQQQQQQQQQLAEERSVQGGMLLAAGFPGQPQMQMQPLRQQQQQALHTSDYTFSAPLGAGPCDSPSSGPSVQAPAAGSPAPWTASGPSQQDVFPALPLSPRVVLAIQEAVEINTRQGLAEVVEHAVERAVQVPVQDAVTAVAEEFQDDEFNEVDKLGR
jgi:hypothetical protein